MSARIRSYALLAFMLILLGKLSGFLKDIIFTYYYGVSDVTDGYFLANSISSLLYIAVYASIPVIVVPLYSRLLTNNDQAQTDRDLTRVMIFFLGTSLVLSSLVTFWSEEIVQVFAAGASEEVRGLANDYLKIMALTFALSTVVGFLNALQSVHKRPLPSYIVPLVNNAIFCFGLMILSASHGLREILYLGVVAWLLLVLVNTWSCRYYFSPSVGGGDSSPGFVSMLGVFAPAAFSFYVEQGNNYVGVYFASRLGDGAISILGYAGKLNLIFLSVFLVFLTATLFPKIARLVADNDRQGLEDYVNLCLRTIFLSAIPIVVFMIFYSRSLVELLFQRGKFSEADAISVAAVLAVILTAVPFALGRDLLNRVFFSRGNTSRPLLISVTALMLNLVFSIFSYQLYGMLGLAWSIVLSTIASFLFATYFVRKDLNIKLVSPNFWTIFVSVCCVIPAVALLVLMDAYVPDFWFLLCLPFASCYFAGLCLCNVREPRLFMQWAQRRISFLSK